MDDDISQSANIPDEELDGKFADSDGSDALYVRAVSSRELRSWSICSSGGVAGGKALSLMGGGGCDDEDDDENAGGDVVDSGSRHDAASLLAKMGQKTRAQDVMISTDLG